MQPNTQSLILGLYSKSHEDPPFQVAHQKFFCVDVVESDRCEVSVHHWLEVSYVDFHLI